MATDRKSKSRYSRQYKLDVVKRVRSSGKTAAEVAADLDLPADEVQRWVDAWPASPETEPAPPPRQQARVSELRRELRTLTVERDFLRRAVAFFATARR